MKVSDRIAQIDDILDDQDREESFDLRSDIDIPNDDKYKDDEVKT